MVTGTRNFEVLDSVLLDALLASGVRPCICEGLGKKMDTVTEAAAYTPPWVRPYCLSHGTRAPALHDMERFPQALNSYSCDPCNSGDHLACQTTISTGDWSCPCTCLQASPEAHAEIRHEAKRTALAAVVEKTLMASVWTAIDPNPRRAALAVADALIEKRLA